LLDHVHVRVVDLEASKRFYAAVADALGVGSLRDGDGWFSLDELFVSDDGPATGDLHIASRPAIGRPSTVSTRPLSVRADETTARPASANTHPGYYAAYVFDPSGTNVEAVFHGPVQRSAPSVVFRW
jgi:catechol 2,3-dioxygenase-like lactoylglutathione lyase family enzyme